jgi:hypothetical protein
LKYPAICATKPSSEFLRKPFTLAIQSSRLHAKPISRSKQQSAIASAAYRAGEKLEDKRVGETFDYTRKQSVEATRIMAPSPAPDWVMDRATLWNTVEATEKRKDAQLAREVQVAIPDELPKDIREKLVWDFCQDNFVSMGMIADVAIHGPTKENPRNWHWHGMLTMRTIGPDGFGLKERSWNETQHVERWKRNWETACNAALEQIGSSTRVDMRSIEDRHAEQLRFAAEATNWIDRMRFEIEAARLGYTARPNLPQKAYRAAAKGEIYPGYEEATAEWTAAIESRGAARARAMQMETELEYLLGLTHHDGGVAISAEDKIINRWLADRFEHDPAILAIMATIADNTPDLLGSACEAQAFEAFDQLGTNPEDPTHDQMAVLEGVGRHILNNGWKHLTHLDHMLRNHDVMWMFNERPEPVDLTTASDATEETASTDVAANGTDQDQLEAVTTAEATKIEPSVEEITEPEKSPDDHFEVDETQQALHATDTSPTPDAPKEVATDAQQSSGGPSKAGEPSQPSEPLPERQQAPETPQETKDTAEPLQDPPAPSQSAAEARRARQEAKAEQKARRAAEKAAARQRAEFEEPVTESRKRVLRVRTPLNVVKGTLENLKAGRDMLEPYPQSTLRQTTDKFLAAATRLLNSWDAYLTDRSRKTDFTHLEDDYLQISAELTEMHLVVAKPKAMTAAELIDEQARLQELEDFPDQSLIKPVMTGIKKRLKQVIAYLTNTDDGRAKADQVAAKKRAKEAEAQRNQEREEYWAAQRRQENERQSRLSTAKKVRAVLGRALKDPEIFDIVASYGFKEGQGVDEIANHSSWRSVAPGTSSVTWHDLERRVKKYDQDQQDAADRRELKQLAETLSGILDRANQQSDPKLDELLKPLRITRFTDRDTILENPTWLQPLRGDDQKRPLWEVVQDRLVELDAIEERVSEQRAVAERLKAEQQKTPKSTSAPKRNDGPSL